jgi:hypothetical protein
MACTAYIYMTKKFDPESSPRASTWPVQPIYMTKKVDTENSPSDSTWSVQPIYMTKNVSPEISPRASTAYIYDEKKLIPKLPLEPLHGLYSLYI